MESCLVVLFMEMSGEDASSGLDRRAYRVLSTVKNSNVIFVDICMENFMLLLAKLNSVLKLVLELNYFRTSFENKIRMTLTMSKKVIQFFNMFI